MVQIKSEPACPTRVPVSAYLTWGGSINHVEGRPTGPCRGSRHKDAVLVIVLRRIGVVVTVNGELERGLREGHLNKLLCLVQLTRAVPVSVSS